MKRSLRDWDSYGDTIAETNKAQEEKEKTLVKEAKTELKEENDQLTRNEDTKETTIDSDTQPYHPLNNLSNLLPAILPVLNSHQNKQIPSSKPKKNMKIPTHAK
ncbi:hypothetical protein BLNAU_14317 [Blattamonas nauphoetae]|uniref:Uncharacterized protein n=1 Tax=Blattamonas nauphoetae TaxID=2049346 RepID=A0ABQ9XE94_9EUKA|nr:hypothetical protein BLNAU_14317 [Blattamonas nauphoetae]